ncbi:hypothetical protein [Streptomyces malaysiensis]
MSPAVAFALHVFAGILAGAVATWAIQRRHNRRLANRITRATARTRLQRHIHLCRDHETRPAPVDDTCLQLEALYRAPAAERRTP